MYLDLSGAELNASGDIAFLGQLSGDGVTTENDFGVFASGALVARTGDTAPGAGGEVFSFFFPLKQNGAGETAFVGGLSGGGVTTANRIGIFATKDGVLDLILRQGDLLDIGGGDLRTLLSLGFGDINDRGDIAFLARFAAGTNGPAGFGVFVYEAGSVSAAVPLPPALGLMLFGAASLGFVGRRRAQG